MILTVHALKLSHFDPNLNNLKDILNNKSPDLQMLPPPNDYFPMYMFTH